MDNLNYSAICTDGPTPRDLSEWDNSAASKDITVFFRNLQTHLIEQIKEAEIVVGCVAWLTSEPILNALAKKIGVGIVVQKEDFLRPDMQHAENSWKTWLRGMYSRLPEADDCLNRYGSSIPEPLHDMSYCNDPAIGAIRCVGNYNREKNPSHPRMHNKFIVLCKYDREGPKPHAVWTGSFNFSKTAVFSLENAILIRTPTIVDAYFKEWALIEAISEPLNWESDWTNPEWRIGS